MHPHYKMKYFKKMKWTEAWRQTALELVQEEWRSWYTDRPLCAVPDREEQ